MVKKIIKLTLVAGILMGFCVNTSAQENSSTATQSAAALNEILFGTGTTAIDGNGLKPGEIIKGVASTYEGQVIGTEFLTDEFVTGELATAKGSFKLPVRYNCHTQQLHVNLNNRIIAPEISSINQVTYLDPASGATVKLINGKSMGELFTNRLVEVLATGRYMLVKDFKVAVQKPNYNPTLHNGSRDTHIIREDQILLRAPGGEIIKLDNRKSIKKFLRYNSECESLVKEADLDLRREADLVQLVSKLNQSR